MPTINGIKYACEPCMRGHRSSKCTHSDRILVQVRKPGRPLSTCPHPNGQCNCNGLRVAIPKASSCACGDNSYANIEPSAPKASRADNDHRGVRGSISTNNSGSAHRVRKHGRRESGGISESLVKAINSIEQKGLKEIQNVRNPPQTNHVAADGNKSAAGLTPGTQDQESLPSLASSQRSSEALETSTISSRLESGVTTQVDLSSASVADVEIGGLDHSEVGSDREGIINGLPSQEAKFDGPRDISPPYSTPSIQPFQRAHTDPGTIQSQPAQPQKACTCGANRNQPTTTRFDVSNPTSAGLSYDGNQDQLLSADQQQAKISLPMNSFPSQPLPPHSYPNLPVTTTLYAIPQRCSTFHQPLSPEELAFLQRNPGFVSRAVSHLASGAMSGAGLTGGYNTTMHNCSCGDTCNCLGCIAHPYNPKTLNFVQSLQDLMTTDNQFEGQNARRLSMQGQPVQDMSATLSTINMPLGNGTMGRTDNRNGNNLNPNQGNLPSPYTTMQSSVSASTFGSVSNGYGVVTNSQPQDMTGHMFVNSGEMQDQFPLSPTAFYHVDYNLGSCGTGGNNCFCGDGCACPGCLVHSGNGGLVNGPNSNNAPLELDGTLGSIPWSVND